MENRDNRFRLIYIIIYVLCIFLIGSLFSLLFGLIVASIRGVSASGVINAMVKSNNYTTAELDAANAAQGYGNAFSYLLCFISAIFLMKADLKNDFIELKNNKKFYSIYTAIVAPIFVGLAFLLSYLVGLGVKESTNQETVATIMRTNALVPMIISTAIFAPFVEEFIYRKCVFHFTSRLRIYFRYIISIVLFVFPHVITSIGKFNAGEFMLMMIPYVVDAFMLALIYHKGKYNVYVSFVCHMLNNVLAIILLFV